MFLQQHLSELLIKLSEQILLTSVAVFIATLLGIPLGILSAHYRYLRAIVISTAGILQTIPSLALLVFLIPLFGIGIKPAIVALSIYALLPIISNTTTGLMQLSNTHKLAAKSLGFTTYQQLFMIELPLA